MRQKAAPDVCPVCDEDVPRGALACPGCGADHNSGWREDAAIYDGLDLPEEEEAKPAATGGVGQILWAIAAIALLLALGLTLFLGR